jgi:hypothetical protein
MPTYTVMIDPLVTLLGFLRSERMEPLKTLLEDRLFVGTELPAGYHPDQGPALLISSRDTRPVGDGSVHRALVEVSAQFLSYGPTQEEAWKAPSVLYYHLERQAQRGGKVRGAYAESIGQPLPPDPDTGWPAVLAYYQFTIVSEWEEIEVP